MSSFSTAFVSAIGAFAVTCGAFIAMVFGDQIRDVVGRVMRGCRRIAGSWAEFCVDRRLRALDAAAAEIRSAYGEYRVAIAESEANDTARRRGEDASLANDPLRHVREDLEAVLREQQRVLFDIAPQTGTTLDAGAAASLWRNMPALRPSDRWPENDVTRSLRESGPQIERIYGSTPLVPQLPPYHAPRQTACAHGASTPLENCLCPSACVCRTRGCRETVDVTLSYVGTLEPTTRTTVRVITPNTATPSTPAGLQQDWADIATAIAAGDFARSRDLLARFIDGTSYDREVARTVAGRINANRPSEALVIAEQVANGYGRDAARAVRAPGVSANYYREDGYVRAVEQEQARQTVFQRLAADEVYRPQNARQVPSIETPPVRLPPASGDGTQRRWFAFAERQSERASTPTTEPPEPIRASRSSSGITNEQMWQLANVEVTDKNPNLLGALVRLSTSGSDVEERSLARLALGLARDGNWATARISVERGLARARGAR